MKTVEHAAACRGKDPRRGAERMARREAQVTLNAMSAFLANMSHELRTPLHSVLGYAELLLSDDRLSHRQRTGLATIEASGKHLLRLLDDVLDFACIEVGRMELDPEPTELQACLGFVADVVRLRAEQKGLRFVLDLDAALPGPVLIDERRLRQVLLNFLTNSVKFTHTGAITLRVRATHHGPAACTLRFEVQDTGVGIPASDVERVFRPFEQAGNRHQRSQGAGLGLAICDALVRRMGGRITVRSEPGRGSSFSFDLTVAAAAPVKPRVLP